MITKTLRTGSKSIKVCIPENLNELTLGQMIAIQEPGMNDLKALAFLSGCSDVDIANVNSEELSKLWERWLSLAHQIKYCYKETAIPEFIYFGDKKVKVIKNLSIEPAGAFLASRNLIADEINRHIGEFGEDDWKENFNPDLNTVALVLAHYFYCRVTGNLYGEQQAEEFKEEVLKLSLQSALPVARHFFFHYPNLLKQRISLWVRLQQSWRNARVLAALKNSRTSTR